MEKEYKFDAVRYLLSIIDGLVDLHFHNCTCPEEHEAWSDFSEEYDRLIYALVNAISGYLDNDKK